MEDDGAPGVPEWVVTYGDMMSLLLTFFIMLVSMSKLKDEDGKTRAMLDGIRETFGPTKGEFGAPGSSLQPSSSLDRMASRGVGSQGSTELSGTGTQGPAGAHKPSARLSQGSMITLGGPAQFPRAEAELSVHLKRNLDIIARVVGPKTNRIMIRGHASPVPFPSDKIIAKAIFGCAMPWPQHKTLGLRRSGGMEIRDKFDLSFARAKTAAEYLISRNIDPRRLVITAAGNTEPRVQPRDEHMQQQNRRVDVFLIDSYITRPQPSR